ncbi:methionine ABC transporter permease [Actinocatenispora rupis]|uniref:Methionine ABC transporter permease n=1 Tax=Actinocatenispora rupis TaxID=519421 RepID=A0A8J3IXS0_9ACTN|nr:methionine ABC transporter permease [Actinocatenispora rupis]GID10680.1 methionine ABC transporter permease [Actinocatenispora rupis]
MTAELIQATLETLQMVVASTVLSAIVGLPVGVLLVLSARGGLRPAPVLNRILGLIVNLGRSLPFIILMIAVIPFTRLLVGTTIGSAAAIVPLTIGAIPFLARLVESAVSDVDPGLVEAAQAMGARTGQIVGKVLLPESRPALVRALTVTFVTLIGYSAMAGAVGGGGLGDLAIRYGYQLFQTNVMVVTVVLLVVVVQVFQLLGDRIARRLDRR